MGTVQGQRRQSADIKAMSAAPHSTGFLTLGTAADLAQVQKRDSRNARVLFLERIRIRSRLQSRYMFDLKRSNDAALEAQGRDGYLDRG